MVPEDRDPKVKELLSGKPLGDVVDEATARELERWFGLPSFAEAEDARPSQDPEVAALLERRAKAIAAVDPALLAAIAARSHRDPETLLLLDPVIELHVDPDLAMVDVAACEQGYVIAEPREVEIPEQLRDDLKDCSPQALLRDLHRPELEFDKIFVWVDPAEGQRVDAVAVVAAAMATSWRIVECPLPLRDTLPVLDEARRVRRLPWPALFDEKPLANRRIVE